LPAVVVARVLDPYFGSECWFTSGNLPYVLQLDRLEKKTLK
jgi:hypothetical protein